MIIQLESARVEDLRAAFRQFVNLGYRWGEEIDYVPAPTEFEHFQHAAALRVSIPSAALTVLDPADRISKRRLAEELIDEAQYLAARKVPTWLILPGPIVELRTLTPDQLLDLVLQP